MSKADGNRARALYEPLVGYSNVSTNLEQIYLDRAEQDRLENGSRDEPKNTGFHKWQ